MINKNKRGQGLPVNKLVITIIIILAVATLLMFFFKSNLLKYLRNLPGYDVPQEDEDINFTELKDEEKADLCPLFIGRTDTRVDKVLFFNLKDDYISFCKEPGITCGVLVSSKLKWNGNNADANIEVDLSYDRDIGSVNNRKITIFPEILRKEGRLYEWVKDDLPESKYLESLNGAYKLGNWICRKNIV